MIINEIAAITFPGYGSIYFSEVPIDPHLKLDFVKGFYLGPHCESMYWNCKIGEARINGNAKQNQGPCKSTISLLRPVLPYQKSGLMDLIPGLDLSSYCSGLIDAGLARKCQAHTIRQMTGFRMKGSITDHMRLLEISRAFIKKLIDNPLLTKRGTPSLTSRRSPYGVQRNKYVSDNGTYHDHGGA